MNLENVEQRTRATKTLDTHRREIEKLVLWFYNNMNNLIGNFALRLIGSFRIAL
jgi:hypothetical protein